MPLSSNAQERMEQLRHFIWMMRRGPKEARAMAVFGVLVVAGTSLLMKGPSLWPALAGLLSYLAFGMFGIAGLLFCWIVYRFVRQALPSPLPPPEVRPSAVKGPMAFGAEDGPLFQRLGREKELEHLLSWILDDQIPLIVVRGESGVGKTSLLRAGLPYILKERNVECIYWEAVPTLAPERLLHAIQAQWQSILIPHELDDVLRMSSQSTPHRIIVLDQFEQLHPEETAHQPIFNILRRIATTQMPPHRTTWIVAFRRDYEPLWRDFEETISYFHHSISIRLFGEEQAKEVLATLAEAAHFTLDHALATDLVKAAARDGRVAAVDLGIGLLMLSELAARKERSSLSLNDYHFAGGSTGLLTEYLRDCLDRFRETEREAMLKALLALTNRDTHQRLAEGRSLDELAQEANWPQIPLQRCLDYLALPQVRLLEKPLLSPGHLPSYRLAHDRLIPSLHQLTGVILAEAKQTRMTFDKAFRAWQNNGEDRRYLLDRKRLRQTKKHLAQIPLGEPSEAKARFLERSTQRINRKLLVIVMLGVLVVGGISVVGWFYRQGRHQNDLSAWGLPPDLYTYQHQLKVLHITAPVRHLRWLKAPLITLEMKQSPLQELTSLPPTLTNLLLWNPTITSLAGLKNLPHLTTLDLRDTGQLTTLAGLEKLLQLTTLTLTGRGITTLSGLENLPKLTSLTLQNTRIPSLAGLKNLPHLTSLTLENTRITTLAGLETLPQLTTLTLRDTRITDLAVLEKLPRLTSLTLSGAMPLTSLAGLENLLQLTTLTLQHTRQITSLAGLEKLPLLTTLSLDSTGITSLAGVEKLPKLTTLHLMSTRQPTNLAGVEKLRQLTTLSLRNTHITNLAGLEELPHLTILDLVDTDVTSIQRLSSSQSLKTLYLPKKIHSLEGLPSSVTHLGLQ